MKIGFIGLPQTGKKTFFELLTGHKPSEKEIVSNGPIRGVIEVEDERFDKLALIYRPKKETKARIDVELLPKLDKDAIEKGDIFAEINQLDIICHIVRAFKDDSIYHIHNSVDPKRDIDFVNSEIILHDLIFVEKRLDNIEKDIKKRHEDLAAKERQLLLKLKAHLDKESPLRLLSLTDDERKMVASYPGTTMKGLVIILNVSEDDLKKKDLLEQLKSQYQSLRIYAMQVSAKVELEIQNLESEEERREFSQAVGVEGHAVGMLIPLILKASNLISFFTVKSDELRQWLIRNGATAPEAAGAIHSDLQRGFIRSEVIKYDDLVQHGSEEALKAAGKFYLKGKDYVVEDGDIVMVRFNV